MAMDMVMIIIIAMVLVKVTANERMGMDITPRSKANEGMTAAH